MTKILFAINSENGVNLIDKEISIFENDKHWLRIVRRMLSNSFNIRENKILLTYKEY
jgi:hypothetical protein